MFLNSSTQTTEKHYNLTMTTSLMTTLTSKVWNIWKKKMAVSSYTEHIWLSTTIFCHNPIAKLFGKLKCLVPNNLF
jgi:hypothetical protein